MALEVSIETITPAKAKRILEKQNAGNRKLRRQVVNRYVYDITHGNWKEDGSPIRFNGDGTLIDGQHRLNAVIEANRSIKSVVIKGIPSNAKSVIDTGAKRSFSDVLHYMGHKDKNQLAAIIRWCCVYDAGDMQLKRTPSIPELLDWMESNPDIIQSAEFIRRAVPFFGLRTPLAAIHFYANKTLPGQPEIFFQQIRDGEYLEKGMPVYSLRRWLENQMIGPHRPYPLFTQAVVIKAWNAYAEGRTIQSVNYYPGKKEEFPKIFTGHQA